MKWINWNEKNVTTYTINSGGKQYSNAIFKFTADYKTYNIKGVNITFFC